MSFIKRIFGDQAVTTPAPVLNPADAKPTAEEAASAAEARAQDAREAAEALERQVAAATDAQLQDWALHDKRGSLRLAAAQALTQRPSAHDDKALWETLAKTAADKDRRVYKLAREQVQRLTAQHRAADAARELTERFTALAAKQPVDLTRLIEADHALDALVREATTPESAALLESVRAARAAVSAQLDTQQTAQRSMATLEREADQLKVQLVAGQHKANAAEHAALVERFNAIDAGGVPTQLVQRTQTALHGLEAVLQTMLARGQAEAKAAELSQSIEALDSSNLEAGKALQEALAAAALPHDLNAPLARALGEKTGIAVAALTKQQQAERDAARQARDTERAAQKADQKASRAAAQEKLKTMIGAAETELAGGHALAALKLRREFFAAKAEAEHLPPDWRARYHAVETDLLKLEGFARDKARERRDGLIAKAKGLTALALPPDMLATEVQAMQAEWKAIDAEGGTAPRKIWDIFHAATNAAYERVTVYRAVKAHEREENAGVRKALLAEVDALVAQLPGTEPDAPAAAPDWKTLANARTTLLKRWFDVGPVNRGESKDLKKQFDDRLKRLDQALDAERAKERQAKLALIAKVEAALADAREEALNPPASKADAPRGAPDKRFQRGGREERGGARDSGRDFGRDPGRDAPPPRMAAAMRVAQESQKAWSAIRGAVPMPRKEGDKLWESFRATCNAIFNLRDEARTLAKAAGDAKRQALQTLIADATAAATLPDAAQIDARLSELGAAWHAHDSRESPNERNLQERFDNAVKRAREAAQAHRRAARAHVWRDVIRLDQTICAIDAARAEDQSSGALAGFHATLAELATKLAAELPRHGGLATRLNAVQSSTAPVPNHAALLEGAEERAQVLLDLELALQLDSPPEAANQRRARQLLMLAGKLKNREAGAQPGTLFAKLLSIAALPDSGQEVRALKVTGLL